VLFLAKLDDIAWLLNIRGSDIPYNPLFFSYMILYRKGDDDFEVDLYIDSEKVNKKEDV
jgi:Xaa-Pro aminopeptidase